MFPVGQLFLTEPYISVAGASLESVFNDVNFKLVFLASLKTEDNN